MRVLVISNLFPNPLEPGKGLFNKQQFTALSKLCDVKVVSPIPFYKNSSVPLTGVVEGIETFYPRFFMTPKLFRSLYGFFFYYSLRSFVVDLHKKWPFDIVLTAWAYPDGFGSWLMAQQIGVPCVIMALGSDINGHTNYFLRRKMIVYALNHAAGAISVSNSLKQRMVAAGVRPEQVTVITNGVNREIFKPMPRAAMRTALALPHDKKITLFAGNLLPGKGADLLIEAFPAIIKKEPLSLLVIAGDGILKQQLENRVRTLGITQHVLFVGRQPLERVAQYMNASNVFCLPSANEGCPNVILEARACGVPVAGSDIAAIADLLDGAPDTALFPVGDVLALANAVLALSAMHTDGAPAGTCVTMSWHENAQKVYALLERILGQQKGAKL